MVVPVDCALSDSAGEKRERNRFVVKASEPPRSSLYASANADRAAASRSWRRRRNNPGLEENEPCAVFECEPADTVNLLDEIVANWWARLNLE